MEMEALKSEMTHMAKPPSEGFSNNGHKARPLFNLAHVCLGASPAMIVYVFTTLMLSVLQRDSCYLCAADLLFTKINLFLVLPYITAASAS